MKKQFLLLLILISFILCNLFSISFAENLDQGENDNSVKEKVTTTIQKTPVTFLGETVFFVYGTDSMSSKERAEIITNRLKRIGKDMSIKTDSVEVTNEGNYMLLTIDGNVVMTVTENDSKYHEESKEELAKDYSEKLKKVIKEIREDYTLKSIAIGIGLTILVTIILLVLIRLMGILFPKIYNKLFSWKNTKIPSLKIQKLELVDSATITHMIVSVTRGFRIFLTLLILYFYITLVFNFFPWTRGFSKELVGHFTDPIKVVILAVLNYIPNIFFVTIIFVFSFYLNKVVRLIFNAIEKGALVIPGFDTDWSEPTYKIARFLIIAFTIVMAFPYLPGSHSPAFQGISVFLGLLISLGSSSAISNIVAGVVLTYTNSFKIGDRVKISDTIGNVVEKTLLVTKIRTIKNVDITIPNSMVLGSHIINYTSSSRKHGLILHTTVTIGYDVPWKKVQDSLIRAAKATEGILGEPEPFVLQTSLDDFYVSYELNAYTDKPNFMAKIYSGIHQNIQDIFNEVGIEILSPHYSALRDGNMITIPENYLDKDYQSPSFKVTKVDL